MEWQRFEKLEYGYTIDLPARWVEQPPDLKNSPLETARFADPQDRRHSVIVFRSMPIPGSTARDLAERAQSSLERHGWLELTLIDARVGAENGVRLDAVKRDAGRVMALREYFIAHDPVGLILATNTTAFDEDEPLISAIAERFVFLAE